MQACIHRGATQIGGSCVEIEHDGSCLLLDLGLPLDADPEDAALLPPVSSASLEAIIVSHPHLDHYGLLRHLRQPAPVAMGGAARRILTAAAAFIGQPPPPLVGPELEHRQPFTIGAFTVTPYLVDHSAYSAYALLIEAGGQRLFYSGDFRAHGRKARLTEELMAAPPGDVDTLLMEGSSLSRLDDDAVFPSEDELCSRFEDIMRTTAGLVMVQMSAQNIDRVVTVFKAAHHTGRRLLIDLYTAAVLEATGNPRLPQSCWDEVALCIPQRQRVQIKREGLFELLDRHKATRVFLEQIAKEPSRYVLVFRPLWMQDLERAGVLDGALLVYSQWRGYLDRGDYALLEGWLARHAVPLRYVHTSGHASLGDLQRLAAAIAPRRLVPIHTFERDRYAELFENVVVRADGTWWEV